MAHLGREIIKITIACHTNTSRGTAESWRSRLEGSSISEGRDGHSGNHGGCVGSHGSGTYSLDCEHPIDGERERRGLLTSHIADVFVHEKYVSIEVRMVTHVQHLQVLGNIQLSFEWVQHYGFGQKYGMVPTQYGENSRHSHLMEQQGPPLHFDCAFQCFSSK